MFKNEKHTSMTPNKTHSKTNSLGKPFSMGHCTKTWLRQRSVPLIHFGARLQNTTNRADNKIFFENVRRNWQTGGISFRKRLVR